ncbi:MAG: energy-coupling factor ABC transporter ATP-binding protein [Promethearchaeota archaeon]
MNALTANKSRKIIEVKNLSFSYSRHQRPIFNGVSFGIDEGDIVALLGSNGSGKTTLFYLLLRILKQSSGELIIDGRDVSKKGKEDVRKIIGFVFQDPNDQLFCPTVWEDVAFGPYNQGLDQEDIEHIVSKTLVDLNLIHLKDKKPYDLSHGEKKLVAIATVLALAPKIYILDEPFANLDGKSKKNLMKIINSLNERNKTIIFSTHDAGIAAEVANNILLIRSEKEIISSPKKDVLRDLELLDSLGINTNPISRLFWELSKEADGFLDRAEIPITVEEGKKFMRMLMTSQEK